MKISKFLLQSLETSCFRLLDDSDNDKIIRFFNQTSMQTSELKLKYIRHPNFFTFLNYQSDNSFVIGSDRDDKNLKAIGSFSIKDCYINQEIKKVAYFGDLRVKGGVSFSRKWQNTYAKILELSNKFEDANFDYAITAIMSGNSKAAKSLVSNKKSQFFYHKLCDYYMVNMIMPYWRVTSLKGKNVFRATEENRGELLQFFQNENIKRPFGMNIEYLKRALSLWPDFDISNFIIVKDENKIVGITATWNPSKAKKIIVDSLPISLKILNSLLAPFTKTAKVGEELKVQYLNFLNINESNNLSTKEILLIMVEFIRQEGSFKKFDLISFGDFEPFNYRKHLKNIICESTKLELFQVIHKSKKNEALNNFLYPPAFEISLV